MFAAELHTLYISLDNGSILTVRLTIYPDHRLDNLLLLSL